MKISIKKYLLVLFFAVVFLPAVASASWWNPFSWKVFNKAPQTSEIEKLRSEVEELKKKTATPTSPSVKKTITPTIKPVVSAKELKKQNPQQYKTLVTENKTQLLEASKTLSNKSIIARIKPSVVYIETTTGSGSGIIISSDGYVLTNAHVVNGKSSATIKLTDGRSLAGTVIGRDENIDLALLKVGATNLSPAFLGDSDLLEQGDPVFTFGYPLGIEGDVAFKDGTLSRRQKIDGTMYLEISAQILPGNSGGPLVNESGEVIGINTLAIASDSVGGVLVGETLKYAMPINVAKSLLASLKAGRNILKPHIVIPPPAPVPSCPENSHTSTSGSSKCTCDDGYIVNSTQDSCILAPARNYVPAPTPTPPPAPTPINGSCSLTHFNCSAGTSANNSSISTFTWSCNGLNGGTNDSCSEGVPLVFTQTPKIVWTSRPNAKDPDRTEYDLSYLDFRTNRPVKLILSPMYPDGPYKDKFLDWSTEQTAERKSYWTGSSEDIWESCGKGISRKDNTICKIKVIDESGLTTETDITVLKDSIDIPR